MQKTVMTVRRLRRSLGGWLSEPVLQRCFQYPAYASALQQQLHSGTRAISNDDSAPLCQECAAEGMMKRSGLLTRQ